MYSRITCSFIGVAMLAGLSGCLPVMDTPKNFIHVEKHDLGDYTMRAVSADGVVVSLCNRPNMQNGTLEFWSRAIVNEMTGRGYTLVNNEAVKSEIDLAGQLLTFSTHSRGAPFTYMLAMYVKNNAVIVAEAGGKASAVKEVEDDLRKSLLSVK